MSHGSLHDHITRLNAVLVAQFVSMELLVPLQLIDEKCCFFLLYRTTCFKVLFSVHMIITKVSKLLSTSETSPWLNPSMKPSFISCSTTSLHVIIKQTCSNDERLHALLF
ncbi:hypothetical protein ILYODFUR_025606 [Ilyodon furcidens]|uniref:Uncharacterized protein n=1 Tax=Ilyodon furcidens TaxID=33524 RepID=A0ABV0UA48_9TELE